MLDKAHRRRDAADAARILNYVYADLLAGWEAFHIFDKDDLRREYLPEMMRSLRRMSLAWMVLSLARWTEFYERYMRLIPPDCSESCKALKREVDRIDLKRFRNVMVGHIFDKKTGMPLTTEAMRSELERVLGSPVEGFLHWIKRLDGGNELGGVATVIRITRDRIIEEFGLTEGEVLG